jgi:two-component sensor histidine kinase
VSAQGPRVLLKSKAAQNFALALHELATNAAKYGALSNSSGHIAISWQADEPSDHFTFRWLERGGPRVSQPPGRGFGSAVLEQVIAQHFDAAAHMDFDAQGVTYQVTCSLSALSPQLDT